MEKTKESINKYGVLVPIIARLKENGNYEIIAGHRCVHAISLLGNETILVDNSFGGMIVDEKGDFKTTKEDDGEHGIGINNVRKTVDKYEGSIKLDYAKNVFSVEVIIPNIR